LDDLSESLTLTVRGCVRPGTNSPARALNLLYGADAPPVRTIDDEPKDPPYQPI